MEAYLLYFVAMDDNALKLLTLISTSCLDQELNSDLKIVCSLIPKNGKTTLKFKLLSL